MPRQKKIGAIFRNKQKKKSFDNKTELVFVSKCFYGSMTTKLAVESPNFMIFQVF